MELITVVNRGFRSSNLVVYRGVLLFSSEWSFYPQLLFATCSFLWLSIREVAGGSQVTVALICCSSSRCETEGRLGQNLPNKIALATGQTSFQWNFIAIIWLCLMKFTFVAEPTGWDTGFSVYRLLIRSSQLHYVEFKGDLLKSMMSTRSTISRAVMSTAYVGIVPNSCHIQLFSCSAASSNSFFLSSFPFLLRSASQLL